MQVYGGELYVGGTFATAGGEVTYNIAGWDGSSWSRVDCGLVVYFDIRVVAVVAVLS